MNLQKSYSPQEFEKEIYENWEAKGYFVAHVDQDKTPFTIVIPPPNITGQLHMGHALNNSIQDAIIRFKRMQGYATLWLPGTDHASIATEVKIVEAMAKEGLTKKELGREKFLERAFEWKEKYGGRIIEQLKCLGSSCDWSRLAFTMDEKCNKAVVEVFVNLYEKGLIYQGDRIINWCPDCKTAISDAEVEHEETEGFFYHIKYPLEDGSGFVELATTRPETLLGDSAIAVNPTDKRYTKLVGKNVMLPLVGKAIPIIADEYVDKAFGTGVVKITPAHDPNDFEVGLRHNLPVIRVLDDAGVVNSLGGKYQGLDRFEARKKMVDDLKEQGLLVKIEPHKHNVGHCYRCNSIIEPIVSKQWFVKMQPLAEPAIDVVKNKKIKFIPKRFEKIYFNWMENIRDWCISRQLWWGHRIPAYYCQDCGETIVSKTNVCQCPKCKSKNIKQDEDVLDTWFSSALWPFSTLGFPDRTEDLKYFYPTDVLVTAYDIIFFWVARMIFSGIEHMHQIPFRDVLITGLVRDKLGRKMSKSLGNGIDPLEIVDKYGADTLRFSLLNGIAAGGDIRYSDEKVDNCKNFLNKLWNASKFVLMNCEDKKLKNIEDCKLNIADKWILKRLNDTIRIATARQEKYELGLASTLLYEFVWNDFCDWYIEMSKTVLFSGDEAKILDTCSVLNYVLDKTLKLLHPFIPFVTEKIYQNLNSHSETIMLEKYPTYNKKFNYVAKAKVCEQAMEIIRAVRNLRQEMNVPFGKRTKMYVLTTENAKMFDEIKPYLQKLAFATDIILVSSKEEIAENVVSLIVKGGEICIASHDLVDVQKEVARLKGEYEKAMGELNRAKGKLSNAGFVSKAPKSLIDAEKEKIEKYEQIAENISKKIEQFES